MLKTIRQFFTPPVFPQDEEKTRTAQILYVLLANMLAVLALAAIATIFVFAQKTGASIAISFLLALTLVSRTLAQRGRVRLASVWFVSGMWVSFTLMLLLVGKIGTSETTFFIALAVIAGILLGGRSAIIVAALSSIVGLGLAILENAGYPLIHYFPMLPLTSWVDFILAFLWTLIPLYLALQGSAKSLARAKKSEQRYATLFNEAPMMYLTVRDEGGAPVVTDCNAAFSGKLGYPREQVVGRPLTNFYTPQSRSALLEDGGFQRALQNEITKPVELSLVTQDGRIIHTLLRVAPEMDEAGRSIGIFAMYLDVTERKRAEDALRANMATLAESESRFRLLAENSTDMISRHDTQGCYLYASPACRTLLGYDPEDLVGHSAFEFIHPDDMAAVEQSRSTITEQPIISTIVFRIRRKTGDYIWLETTSRTIFDKDSGNILEIHAASRDVSERKQVEDALYRRTHDLGERVKELNCLYRISELMGVAEKPLAEILQGMIELLPPAWQFPSVTCARLTLDGQIFHTANFEETRWKQTAEIILDSKIIGLLEVGYLEEQSASDDGPFLKEERFLINAVAEHTGKIIERKRAEEQVQLLQSILIGVSTVDDLSSTLDVVLRRVCERTGWVLGQAWLPRRDGSALDYAASWFSDAGLEEFRTISMGIAFSPGQGLPGRVWASKQPAWLENAPLDPNFPRAQVAAQLGLKAALALPILAKGEVVGVIEFFQREQRMEDEWRVNVIGAVAAQLGLVMERKRAEDELRRADELFRAVVEDQTDMIVRWKPDGTRTFVNQAYCRTFGKTYEEIVGTSFWPVVAEQFRERKLEWIRSLTPDSPYSTSVHVSLLPDGGTQWQEWADRGFFDEQGHLVELQSVGRDITERKRVEQEERQHAARRETLAGISQALANVGLDAQSVFDAIARYTAEHIGDTCVIRLLSSDGQWLNLVAFHHPVPEMATLLKPAYLVPMPTTQEWFRQVLETGNSVILPVMTEQQFKLLPVGAQFVAGQFRLHSALVVPLRTEGRVIGTIALTQVDPDRPSYTHNDQVLLQELADRAGLTLQNVRLFEQVEGARERLEALSRRLLEVQEAERRALTSELHDRVGQNLTGLSINLQNMKALLSDEMAKTLATKFDDAQTLVQDTTRDIRDIMAELHLPELEDYGLAVALETYAERVASRAQLEVIADLPDLPTPRLPSNVRSALFRAAQEAISNVLKHAKATQLEVRLEQRDGRVRLMVGDNGKGFEAESASQKAAQTWGLNIMRERIEAIGGRVQVESRLGEGTRVTFEVGRSQ